MSPSFFEPADFRNILSLTILRDQIHRETEWCDDLTISIDLTRPFLAISKRMRVLVVTVIVGVLIWLGWTKPFKERYAQAKTTITSELNGLGKKPQKKQDASEKRH